MDLARVAETGEVLGAALEIPKVCPEDEGDDLGWRSRGRKMVVGGAGLDLAGRIERECWMRLEIVKIHNKFKSGED